MKIRNRQNLHGTTVPCTAVTADSLLLRVDLLYGAIPDYSHLAGEENVNAKSNNQQTNAICFGDFKKFCL